MFQIKIGAGLKTIEGNLEVNQRTNNLQDEFLVKRHSVSVISYESETTSFVRPKLCEVIPKTGNLFGKFVLHVRIYLLIYNSLKDL